MTNEQLAQRQTLWNAYIKDHQPDATVAHHLQRMLFAYTRYPEAESALNHLPHTGGHVLDFGCGVGDYGVSFARRSWTVSFCDVPEILEFVRFRCRHEAINAEFIESPSEFEGFDAVVFGEVLEHLTNPLELLTDCVQHVRWIVTSSYPLSHADEYWTRYPDHTDEARMQQPACLKLLRSQCECRRGCGMLRVWENRSLREAD